MHARRGRDGCELPPPRRRRRRPPCGPQAASPIACVTSPPSLPSVIPAPRPSLLRPLPHSHALLRHSGAASLPPAPPSVPPAPPRPICAPLRHSCEGRNPGVPRGFERVSIVRRRSIAGLACSEGLVARRGDGGVSEGWVGAWIPACAGMTERDAGRTEGAQVGRRGRRSDGGAQEGRRGAGGTEGAGMTGGAQAGRTGAQE